MRGMWFPFEAVVAAVDGSAESIEAAVQGSRIAWNRPIALVYVLDTVAARGRVDDFPAWADKARRAASDLLAGARDQLAARGVATGIEASIVDGGLLDGLRYVTTSRPAGLLTLGPEDELERPEPLPLPTFTDAGRSDWVVESVTCSVLVARTAPHRGSFPAAITVGVDGSKPSVYAYKVAAAIAENTGAELTVLAALGGKGPDLRALDQADPHVPVDRIDPGHPVRALLDASADGDLLVVGNRGLHGLRALGSVSGRLAARSSVSVLVVRQPTKP